MASELRMRAVLTPTMLLVIALTYWLDHEQVFGWRQGIVCASLIGLLGLGGVIEFVALLRNAGFKVSRRLLLVLSPLLLGSAYFFEWETVDRELYPLVSGTLVVLFALAVQSLRQGDMHKGLKKQGATLLGFIWITWAVYLAMGICFRHLPSMLYLVLVCKGGDIGGYCFGRLFGRTKLIPHISPGKTIEGAVGSLAVSITLAITLRESLLGQAVVMSLPLTIGVGAALNFTTQAGDLVESLLKRRCNAKDSSRLLPAHGGILDLIDSLLFSWSLWFLVLVWLT